MKKIFLIVIALLANVSLIFSQYADEALRYSYVFQGGTARSSAMGTSFNGLGGDAGCLYFNPAGIGVYRTSELAITPNFNFGSSNSSFLNTSSSDFNIGADFNNYSAIMSLNIADNNINFGFAYTNLNNFDNNIAFGGQNFESSMTDYFASRGNGTYYEQLDRYYSGLAWDSYLINNTNSTATNFVTAFNSYGIMQKQKILRSGRQGEYSFTLGGSIDRKIYLGATIGVQSISYTETKQFTETDADNLVDDFNYFEFEEKFSVRGFGVNFKVGFLANPIEWMRIGAAIHTPTIYSIDETYSTYLYSEFDTVNYEYYSPQGSFKYQLNTPFRVNASAGFIIGNFASVNFDYEYLNYAFAKLRSDYDDMSIDNDDIKNNYNHGHNLRLGLEFIVTDFMALRAGVAYYGSPYKNAVLDNNFTIAYSGGVGFKMGKNWFIDLSYTYLNYADDLYYAYNGYGVTSPLASIETNNNKLKVSVGFKF